MHDGVNVQGLISFLGLLIVIIGGFIRLEHRLTALETMLTGELERSKDEAVKIGKLEEKATLLHQDMEILKITSGLFGKAERGGA